MNSFIFEKTDAERGEHNVGKYDLLSPRFEDQ